MCQKCILRMGYVILIIQLISGEDVFFFYGLMEDVGKCLGYFEWFESYKVVVEICLVSDCGELDEYDKRSIKYLFDNVFLCCYLEIMVFLFQDEILLD